ncbi:elongator associated protein [Salpingoeca rosetta]|uniref:Elongator associated protein n=1 Tax=Salpingoeca rosetta (strain ATCC 50818 / BSB-021) TaxID=946362 RepID=F2UAC3_SALR5|nr:elongator associated protein [Salpingoeca rosetta]EGD73698.1 elongator associated protein [Salpingoeca rosetta]|eukprot:XP_004993979.1 elongator associated protein [Salpingoeca rosetta]
MPLVVLCGFPCSGKTRRAKEVHAYMQERGVRSVIVGDESEGIDLARAYETPKVEKTTRGVIKSAVDRALAKDVVVIVDSLNYIKGYRYELYCLARALQTPHCIVHTLARDAECIARHEELGSPYGEGNAAKLIQRFEAPNDHQRWDRPTFAVTHEETLPLDDIYKCLFEPEKVVKAHQATQSQPISATNFLYELDRITQAIVAAILKEMRTAVVGDDLAVPETDAKVHVKRKFTMSELRRSRQAFITYTKSHPVSDTKAIGALFVNFLNHSS